MSRPLLMIALLLAVIGAIFLVANVAGEWGILLVVVAVILAIVGVLTGR